MRCAALHAAAFCPARLRSYAAFVEALEGCSRDNLDFVKDRAVKTMADLLSSKPEQMGSWARALGALLALVPGAGATGRPPQRLTAAAEPAPRGARAVQEARLLSALVNKLGDPDRKLASKVRSRVSDLGLPFERVLRGCGAAGLRACELQLLQAAGCRCPPPPGAAAAHRPLAYPSPSLTPPFPAPPCPSRAHRPRSATC